MGPRLAEAEQGWEACAEGDGWRGRCKAGDGDGRGQGTGHGPAGCVRELGVAAAAADPLLLTSLPLRLLRPAALPTETIVLLLAGAGGGWSMMTHLDSKIDAQSNALGAKIDALGTKMKERDRKVAELGGATDVLKSHASLQLGAAIGQRQQQQPAAPLPAGGA